jgi:hypothetical protein
VKAAAELLSAETAGQVFRETAEPTRGEAPDLAERRRPKRSSRSPKIFFPITVITYRIYRMFFILIFKLL